GGGVPLHLRHCRCGVLYAVAALGGIYALAASEGQSQKTETRSTQRTRSAQRNTKSKTGFLSALHDLRVSILSGSQRSSRSLSILHAAMLRGLAHRVDRFAQSIRIERLGQHFQSFVLGLFQLRGVAGDEQYRQFGVMRI